MKTIVTFFALFLAGFFSLNAQSWSFDKSHTEIRFAVTHMVISEVSGSFSDYDGSLTFDGEDLTKAQVRFSANTESVNTGNEKRDGHLRSDDFFNSEEFPQLSFEGSSFEKVDEKNYKLTGELTIRDVTKTIELDVKYSGVIQDPWGNNRAGFKIRGEINRMEYGLKWNSMMEAGGLVVSEEVELLLNVEMVMDK
jgi:polyisoprenoid-binding protein YceI